MLPEAMAVLASLGTFRGTLGHDGPQALNPKTTSNYSTGGPCRPQKPVGLKSQDASGHRPGGLDVPVPELVGQPVKAPEVNASIGMSGGRHYWDPIGLYRTL